MDRTRPGVVFYPLFLAAWTTLFTYHGFFHRVLRDERTKLAGAYHSACAHLSPLTVGERGGDIYAFPSIIVYFRGEVKKIFFIVKKMACQILVFGPIDAAISAMTFKRTYGLPIYMVTVRMFVLDAAYKIALGKARVYLYGRTEEGKQIVIVDENFDPYFVVVPRDIDKCKARLGSLVVKDDEKEFRVTRLEEVQGVFDGVSRSVLHVYASLPGAIPFISKEVVEWQEVESVNEYDIHFVKRYMLDKGIYPLSLVEVTGEIGLERSRAPIIIAQKVIPLAQGTYDQPKMLAVDIETYQEEGKGVDFERNPILMIALYGKDFEHVITWKNFDGAGDYVDFVESEAAMLERFRELVISFSPDILVGYYSDGFDLPYIDARAQKFNVRMDLGMDHSHMKVSKRAKKEVEIPGLVHLDVLAFIRRVIGRTMETDVFTLDAVAQELLGERKKAVSLDHLPKAWDAASKELAQYADYNLHDARLTYRLANLIMPNLIEIVRITGLLPFEASRDSITGLIEGYSFRRAKDLGVISYNKPTYRESSSRMSKKAKGAFVYEPIPGLYDGIAVFDFRSLYPSIIVSHNISPETKNCRCCEGRNVAPIEGQTVWFCEKKKGFVPAIIEELIVRRNRIKALLKEKKDPLLNARSDALKWLANSFYGYLGFAQSRWYSFECVEAITGFGRKYITTVIALAKERGFNVLYSDTDSIFLQLMKNTKEDAARFVEEVNYTLPGMMELDYENYYPRGLFVGVKGGKEDDEEEKGAKKKYAMVSESGDIKVRGFETVRRNSSFIAKETQMKVLELVLKDNDPLGALDLVKKTIEDLKCGRVPVEKVVILTMLTKDTDSYETKGPHVAAAERLKSKGFIVGPGSMIHYVIAKGQPKDKIRDKVRLPDEITSQDIDSQYYIENQVIPAVERILSVLGYNKDELQGESRQGTLGKFF